MLMVVARTAAPSKFTSAPDDLRFEFTSSAPLLLGSIRTRSRASSGAAHPSAAPASPRVRRAAPCRFSSISLNGWPSWLPRPTSRSPTFDPWSPDSEGAPRGIRRHGDKHLAAPAAADDDPARCAPAPDAGGARLAAPGAQKQPAPLDDGALLQETAAGRLSAQPQRRQRRPPAHEPKSFPEWLAQLLPHLPGGPVGCFTSCTQATGTAGFSCVQRCVVIVRLSHQPVIDSFPLLERQELRQSLPLWLVLSPPGAPDKRRLMTVQEFFQYSEKEGAMLVCPDSSCLDCLFQPMELHLPCAKINGSQTKVQPASSCRPGQRALLDG